MVCIKRSLEEAAMICKDTSKYAEAADLVDRAATLYCESSSADTAVNALEKAAKLVKFPCMANALLCCTV